MAEEKKATVVVPVVAAGQKKQDRAVEKKPKDELRGFLNEPEIMERLGEVAPKWMKPDRLVRLMLAARSRTPKIAQCSKDSILLFLMRCAETGLEPIGAGGAHAVPYWNSKGNNGEGCLDLQFIPDYRGLIQLAKKTGQIKHAYAHLVREGDQFDYQLGDEPKLVHKPAQKQGEVIGAYCIVILPDNTKHIEYMPKEEVEAIRLRSKAAENGPWKTDPGEMAKKTVTRRGLKPFMGSPEMLAAVEYDNMATGLKIVDLSPIAAPRAIGEGEKAEPTGEPKE